MIEGPSSFAVELEPPPTPRRRHRWISLPSGVLLFVCLFLPAVKSCGEPVYPFELAPLTTPYLLGLLVALVALMTAPGAVSKVVWIARALMWATVIGWTLFLLAQVLDEGDAYFMPLFTAVPGAVVLAIFGRGKRDERAATRMALGTAVLGIGWFGMWCFDGSALIGVYLSAAASVGLFIGALEWRREIARDEPSYGAPRAIVV